MELKTRNNIFFFESNLLKTNGFNHAFLIKRLLNNEPAEIQNRIKMHSKIHFLKQIHSNKVIEVHNKSNSKKEMGDCLITKENNQSLWIYSADCIPILIADKKTRNISACHSGLNGLKKKIISNTLKKARIYRF